LFTGFEPDSAETRARKPEQFDYNLPREIIPNEADFLLGYSTVRGYVSYRNRDEGSLYVNKLVDMLNTYSPRFT